MGINQLRVIFEKYFHLKYFFEKKNDEERSYARLN